MAALLITTSKPPTSASRAFSSERKPSRSNKSAVETTSRPAGANAAASCSAATLAGLLSTATTVAPRPISCSVVCSPNPPAAPV
ncbi:hypothetical protein D3C85_1395370 [compost metagenome]